MVKECNFALKNLTKNPYLICLKCLLSSYKRNGDIMKEKFVGIGAAAKLSGLSERTLRYWESLGLIKPVRLPSGHRKFSKTMVKKIIAIKDILDKYKLRINDLITSSKFLQDDLLKNKVKTPDVFDLNIALDSEIYEYAKKAGKLHPLTGLPDALFLQQEM